MKAFCISGLGADESVFEKIEFPEGYEKICLPWLEPEKKESLTHYSLRMADQMDMEEDFVLVGLSFGGMISTILTPLIKPKKTILISSITGRDELPWYFRTSGRMKLNTLLHMKTVMKAAPYALDLLGAKTPDDKERLKHMIARASVNLVQWSIDKILNWDNRDRPEGIVQIHGTRDLILPHIYTHPDFLVNDGTHFMIRNKAAEVNEIIAKILNSNNSV